MTDIADFADEASKYYDNLDDGMKVLDDVDEVKATDGAKEVTGKSGSTTIHNDILDSPRTGSALKVDDINPIYKINEKTGKPQIVKEFPATAQSHGFNNIVDNGVV